MRSMYRFSIIALTVGAVALFAAGTAFAEYKLGGAITADLEYATLDSEPAAANPTVDPDASSQIGVQTEAVLDFSAANGPLSMKLRLEVNEDKTTLDNVRNHVKWQITDAFAMTFSGMSFGESAGSSMFGATTVGHFTPMSAIAGHQAGATQWVFGVNQQSADFQFKFGSSNAGLVLQPGYRLDGNQVGSGAAATFPGKETMTITPYYNGTFGNLEAHVYLGSASGKKGSGQSFDPKGSETSVGVIFKTGAMKVALQIAPGKYTLGVDNSEHTTQTMNLGASFGGIKFHYITESDENDTASTTLEDITDIALSYSGPIGGDAGEWTVGYATEDTKGSGSPSVGGKKESVLSFGMSIKY